MVVKATFTFVADGIMPAGAPDEIHATEIHYAGSPAQSVWAASDLAPFRARADVVLTGHAPVPEESATVRLAVYRDFALIDKSFDVVPSGDLEGKDRVPLRYEHAPGGPESDDNPVGTSHPSIVDSSDPQRPVGFGPIAAAWPARARLLGALDPRALAAPIAVLPDDLDWSYFGSAPADQAMEYLQGDEWIVLENLTAAHPLVRMRLPSAHAEARVSGLGPEPGPAVTMVADHLHIDIDRACCSVTWRGSFEVGSEDALQRATVLVGVAMAGQPIVWPALPPPRRALASAPPPSASRRAPVAAPPLPPPRASLPATMPEIDREPNRGQFEMTMVIEDEQTSQPALPFTSPSPARPRVPPPPAPEPAAPERDIEATMTIADVETARAVTSRALPFASPARVIIPSAPLPRASYAIEDPSTTDDEFEELTVPRTPAFRRAQLGASARPSQGIPGAPWSGVPAAAVPRPSAETDEQTKTLSRAHLLARVDPAPVPGESPPPSSVGAPAVESPPAPPVPAAAEPPPAATPEAPTSAAKPGWSWASVADAPRVEIKPPPPPPRPPPKPAGQSALYSRFTAKKK